MARPYLPDKFERDISPLSPQSASSQTPISYSANVYRQKTKKWVEAKPADYGGEDWGDGDNYDDYSAPPAPPISTITGSRQPSQASQSPTAGGFSGAQQGNKKAYGDLPSIPIEAQPRSATNPVKDRTNSFTQDDERRAFSGGYAYLSAGPGPASARILPQGNPAPSASTTSQSGHPPVLQVSTQVPAVTGLRKFVQSSSPAASQPSQGSARGMQGDEPTSGTSSKYSEAASKYSEVRTPASDFQTRRDFSPSAAPQPLQSRYSPAPHSATNSPSSRFPPRKSSISHPIPPEVFETSQPAQEVNAPKPMTGARSSSPGATARSPTSPSKSLPFIRPADIYKRLEEEREKERQSMDSNRPSMEAIVGSKASERPASPGKAPLQGQSSSESLGRSYDRELVQESEDRQDSSWHPAPMLEPVQERKSEYGFEGFDPTLARNYSREGADFEGSKEAQMEPVDAEEMRRFSTSPKLPDVARISGFGLDLFPKSDNHETSVQDSVLQSIPENDHSTAQNASSLRTQPSLGFTSVVQQAFDAGNPSFPDTPASVTSNRVERSGSESAGTTGISPIMSRLPNTGIANTQDKLPDAHETTTPSIAEVDEPESGEESAKVIADVPERQVTPPHHRHVEGLAQHPIHPGHSRSISTSSSGNSPARIPNVATTERVAAGEEAHISPASDQPVSPVDEELLALSRPFPERELSFRPALPGAYVSYTTSTTAEPESNNTQPIEAHNPRIDPMDEPVSPISETEDGDDDDDDVDLTPTTAKRTLPQSALGAAAGAAFGGVAATAFDRRDKASPNSHPPTDGLEHVPQMMPSNSALPIPNPTIAPAGNPYAASALDPRLQAESTHGKSALQLPNASSPDAISTTSTEPPTPPPKDTPADGLSGENPEYFPPIVPLKHKTLDEMAVDEGLVPPIRPQMLPTLSTQTSPQDEESDKLRKEIMKSLSPKVSDMEAGQRLAPPNLNEGDHGAESTAVGTRESTYLPSEYDKYWESTNEVDTEQREVEERAEESGPKPEPEKALLVQRGPAVVQDTRESTPSIPPLNPQKVESTSMEALPQRPPLHSNRFSWEAGPEEVSSSAVPINNELRVPNPGIDPRYAATPNSQLRRAEETGEAYFGQGPSNTSMSAPAPEGTPAGRSQDDTNMKPANIVNDLRRSGDQVPSDGDIETAVAAPGVAGIAAYVGHQMTQHEVPQRRLSLAEEKSPANASTYAVSPTPPEDEHPARVSQPIIPPMVSTSGQVASEQLNGLEPAPTFRPQITPNVTKIIQFRDILALQTPEQRIRAYNDARHQFAVMDIGLHEWLMLLSNQRTPFPTGPTITNNSAERPKVTKSNVPGTPLQQPYYQQYLNASPASSTPSATRPGTGITSSTQQGFSPSSSKLSGQQGQAKGKDILHSAGVFGGKASKAGKGFFAKGKNKLRGSGGGDKNSPPLEASPPPKPKVNEGRTSSWNMSLSSLTLPRSSARADSQSQNSREAITPPRRHSELGPETPNVAPQRPSQQGSETRPGASAGQTELSLWEAPVSAASTPSIPKATPQPTANNDNYNSRYTTSQNPVSNGEEEDDAVGVPAPIGKHQPSWDPYNATPIVEEESFQYDQRSLKQTPAIQTAVNHPGSPQVPSEPRKASEEHAEDDWVIISKENVPKSSELTYRPPIPAPEQARTGTSFNQPAPVPQFAQQHFVPQQRQATSQAVANQPIVGFQHSTTYQHPAASEPAAGHQPPPGQQPSAVYQPAAASQAPAAPKGGFRDRFIQHIKQRSSTDSSVNVPAAAGQTSPPRAATKVEQSDPPQETQDAERRPTEFVGLPPIRRSSTFGLAFRAQDPNKRFPLDDDEEDGVPQVASMPSISEPEVNSQRADLLPLATTAAQRDPNGQFGNRLPGGHATLGATAIAVAMGDRMNQPSGQSFRFSNQASTEIPQRLPLSNASSDYSRSSSFSPVSPPVSSPVSPPESRPAFAATPQRESASGPTNQQVNPQQAHLNQDRRSEVEWRSNVNPSQGQQAAPTTAFQYPSLFEGHQIPSNMTPTATHPGHPSFEGQHPAIPPSHGRGSSLESQRIRSLSSASQGNAGNLPVLGSGVFVPPSRAGPNQQKSFDQPPSAAQRYPALFRAEHGKEASVDGLPANYYQAPISKEDAFLPRQQTNEYQLPGVGPPPDEPNSGKRHSRRNSALLKELGGRLSRSASRDRESSMDDEGRSPIRPVSSRDSNNKEYSAASFTSEDTVEQKKRRSGLGFFGALRRETTGGSPQSRESMVTHLPGSRIDLVQPQQSSSPLAPPNKKKPFFSNSRNLPGADSLQQNKLSRTSTSSLVVEQPGKKKRFSGLTNMFSRPNPEQEGKDPRASAVQAAQDPRNYQHPPPHSQGHQYLEYPNRTTGQALGNFNEGARLPGQGALPPQGGPQYSQDNSLRSLNTAGYVPQTQLQPVQAAQTQGLIRQDPAVGRLRQMSQPLPITGLQNPTLQQSIIEGPLAQPRRFSEQSGPKSQSLQSHQQQMAAMTPSGPLLQTHPDLQNPQNRQRQTPGDTQTSPLSQATPNSQSPQNPQQQTPPINQSAQLYHTSAPPHSPDQMTDNRVIPKQSPPQVGGPQLNLPALQVSQQPQYQQRMSADSQQVNSRSAASQVAPRTSQERQHQPSKQSPVQVNQTRVENKQRQGSTARLLSGLIGGRRSAGQGKDTAEAQTGAAPQMTPPLGQQQQHQQHPQQQQQWLPQQRTSANNQIYGTPGHGQPRGRPIDNEPQYEPLPIPGAYGLVRGEGGQLAPTPYNPRGLNSLPGPQNGQQSTQQHIYQDRIRNYPSRPPQIQVLPYSNDQYSSIDRPNVPQIITSEPQSTTRDVRPSAGPIQNSQHPNKVSRPLSREDLVARSPARPQFGQQAPYQLSLPDENREDDEQDRALPTDKMTPLERPLPPGGKPQVDKPLPAERGLATDQASPPTTTLNTSPQLLNPIVRHPLSPATYPLPEDSLYSPINPKADQIPLPPPPKWPQLAAPSQNLDRSNTINTHGSEVSQLSGQLNIPGPSRPKEQERPASVTPPSPQITPERSPEQVPRHIVSPPAEEDVYSASPRNTGTPPRNEPPASAKGPQSPEKIVVDEGRRSQSRRRRTSQEEKILVEEGMRRPGSAEEEIPSMSATSYPGQEWHPYGNGYEEWD